MVKKSILALLTIATLAASAGTAAAQDAKRFGMGIIVGEPTGIDAKLFLTRKNALQFALAWSLSDENEMHLQGDYVWHNYDLIKMDGSDELPLYFGVGVRAVMIDDFDDVVGIRFPVGLDYIFANYPFDIFAEIVPILDVSPETDFDLEGAIGARFWF